MITIILTVAILCIAIGMYIASQIGYKIDLNIERQDLDEETEYSCCGDDMTGKDINICPTCKEHQ